MGDTGSDPVDHYRTTRPLAGETTKNTAKAVSLIFVAVTLVAFVACLASFALRQVGIGLGAAIVGLLAAGAALAWSTMEGRRLRQVQRETSKSRRGGRLRR
jgi:hypothetical protein